MEKYELEITGKDKFKLNRKLTEYQVARIVAFLLAQDLTAESQEEKHGTSI